MEALLTQRVPASAIIRLPIPTHQEARFFPQGWRLSASEAYCEVVKDAGDDPDVTHGALICATVRWRNEPGLLIRGGEGVGVVTRPGLGLEVGGPAINPVPRRMITTSVEEVVGTLLGTQGVEVTISVPTGEELAKKTFNPRLGILGGISILGTTGIVHPYSTASWRASVVQAVEVAAANGCRTIVLSTGGTTEGFAKRLFPDWPEMAFVEMGIFTGAALKAAVRVGIHKVILSGQMGKFSKIAQGHMQTHVAGNRVDTEYLADIAAHHGAAPAVRATILEANTARHVGEILSTTGLMSVFDELCVEVCRQCRAYVKDQLAVEAIMFDYDGSIRGRASYE
jgi:cobalt-precorrin-5B (C1)-methyltransferase